MLQNSRVAAFTVSDLLRENHQGRWYKLNHCISIASFPNLVKYADITSVFKKGDVPHNDYRLISTLSKFSKIFKRLTYKQTFEFMNLNLSKYVTGFWKNPKTLHILLKMKETWRSRLKCGNKFSALVMGLSKAFDTALHHLFLFKLKAYSFNENYVLFIRNCLTNRY